MHGKTLTTIALLGLSALGENSCVAQNAPAQAATASAAISSRMDEVVAGYRKVIVLMDHSAALDDATASGCARQPGSSSSPMTRDLRHWKWICARTSASRAAADHGVSGAAGERGRMARCGQAGLPRSAGRTGEYPAEEAPSVALRKRIASDSAAIERIHRLYQSEVTQIFSAAARRAPVQRRGRRAPERQASWRSPELRCRRRPWR